MKKFQATSSTSQEPTRDELIEALLVEAGAANLLPTDEGKILGFLKLEQMNFDFMHELAFLPKQSTGNKVELRAALSVNDRLIATQSGLSVKRKRFGIFHEIGHFILPEHREKLFLIDNDETLSWWTRVRIEKEANEIAAELVFQGNRFTEEAHSYPTSVRTVTQLAPVYGASYESAIRRYTERHVLPCAVVIYQKTARESDDAEFEDTDYNIHYSITSPSFRKEYFSGLEVKGGPIKGSDFGMKGHWWGVKDIVEQNMNVAKADGETWHFETEVFTNGYKIFQFVLPPKAL